MKRNNSIVAMGRIQQGFTLIELMIVVVIIAIIASIAIPSYSQYTTKARRAAAQTFMQNIATKQEQFILDARTYSGTIGSGGLALTIPDDVTKSYTIALSNISNSTYTITATPKVPQSLNDTQCGTLTLIQTGAKTPTTAGCW